MDKPVEDDMDLGDGKPDIENSIPESRTDIYKPPAKAIHSPADLAAFKSSKTYSDLMGFVLKLNETVTGKALPKADEDTSPAVKKTVEMLHTMSAWVDEIPPVQHQVRYGNPAFKTWFERLSGNALSMNESLLPTDLKPAAVELAPYLIDSFGNATRIDYGTGHETTFVAWLCCCSKVGIFTEADSEHLVTHVFAKYVTVMRKIQTTYWLEPAGSHGVWGLDDYCFLPFLWGSAQLLGHKHIKPRSIHNEEVLEGYADAYFYLGSVKFVKQVKKGRLAETSPMLNDISGVVHWEKVNQGMIKMYEAEVLGKVPIMQHFLFGSLLPFPQ